jgi:hypothetical protein
MCDRLQPFDCRCGSPSRLAKSISALPRIPVSGLFTSCRRISPKLSLRALFISSEEGTIAILASCKRRSCATQLRSDGLCGAYGKFRAGSRRFGGSNISSASSVVAAVRTTRPISEAMSRHSCRVASSSSTIRMDTPTALALKLAGLGSISTITFQNVHDQCQNEAEKLLKENRLPQRVAKMYTEGGLVSIN